MIFLCSILVICLTSLSLAQNNDNTGYINRSSLGAWGIKNSNHDWVVRPSYDTMFYLTRTTFDSETYEVTRHKTGYILGHNFHTYQWCLLYQDGSMRYKAEAILPRLMGNVILVKKKNKWGLVNTKGNILLPVQCTKIAWHEDVLALKDKKGKWHLFDPQNGRLETQQVFDKVTLISPPNKEVLLLVEKNGQQGIIDQYFRTRVPINYLQIAWEKDKKGYVYYKNNQGQCGYIHLKTRKTATAPCKE